MNRVFLCYTSIFLHTTYLVLDVVHYINYRFVEDYPDYLFEGVYESHFLSYTKWLLVVFGLVSMIYFLKGKEQSLLFTWGSALLVLLIFMLKGQISEMTIGSMPYNFWILEIAALLSIFMVFRFLLKNGSNYVRVGVSSLTALLIYFILIHPMENVIMIVN